MPWEYAIFTRSSEISECLCVCAASCPSPDLTPFDNSQSSPLQQVSLVSITTRRVFVSLARSPWSSLTEIEVLKPNIDCVRDPVIEAADGEPGRLEVVKEGESSGNVKWVGRKARRRACVRTAAASRLLIIRSASMHILCHCSISGAILPRTTLFNDELEYTQLHTIRPLRVPYASLSSKSLGIVISSILSTRFDADSSSKETAVFFRHASKDGSDRNTESTPSSLMTGWFLSVG